MARLAQRLQLMANPWGTIPCHTKRGPYLCRWWLDPLRGKYNACCYSFPRINWICNIRKLNSLHRYLHNTTKHTTALILGLHPANERRRYFVTTSFNGWVQAQNQPWYYIECTELRVISISEDKPRVHFHGFGDLLLRYNWRGTNLHI